MRLSFVKMLLLASLVLFTACEVGMPEGVITPDKMESVLHDYHLAQVMTAGQSTSSYEKKLHINYVFDKYGITKEVFDSSLVWYTRYPKHMLKIYSKLEKKLAAEINSGLYGAPLYTTDYTADTLDLWGGARVQLLSSSPICNRVTFDYSTEEAFAQSDSVSLSFTARYLQSPAGSFAPRASAALVVEYADNSYASRCVDIKADGNFELGVGSSGGSLIKRVRGFVYYTDSDSLCLSKLLLGDMRVKRVRTIEDKK